MTSELDKDILQEIIEREPEKDQTPELDNSVESVEDYEKQHETIDLKNAEVRSEMLKFAFKHSVAIVKEIAEDENDKRKFRRRIVRFLVCTLSLSLLFAAFMIIQDARGILTLSSQIFIAFLTTVIAQIVSLMVLFVRHATDTQSLKMYETTTHKILDYLTESDSPHSK